MSRRLHLLRLLEDFSPSPDEELAHAQMLVLARSSHDVLSRYHYAPGHFTASGFVVSRDGEQLILVHHQRLGMWLQPGGHIEPADADLWAAVAREISEETGITELTQRGEGTFDVDVHWIPAGRGEPGHEHHDVRFLFEADGEPAAGDGVIDAAWIPLAEVPGLTRDHSVLRAVNKLG